MPQIMGNLKGTAAEGQVSYADLIALAGAQAVAVTGGPRIQVGGGCWSLWQPCSHAPPLLPHCQRALAGHGRAAHGGEEPAGLAALSRLSLPTACIASVHPVSQPALVAEACEAVAACTWAKPALTPLMHLTCPN